VKFLVAMTETEIIDALGGTVATAALLNARPNAVSNWRKRGMPAWAKLKLGRICQERDIVIDPLFFEAKPASPRREEVA
jgi:hypothetical protein